MHVCQERLTQVDDIDYPDTTDLMVKILPNIWKKVAKKVTEPKNAKISTSKLNWKVQNIYIKTTSETLNVYNKPRFNTSFLVKDVKIMVKNKVAKK